MNNYFTENKYRSNCPEVVCNKGVLENFTKFTGNRLDQSLFFNKVAGLRHKVFSCEFAKSVNKHLNTKLDVIIHSNAGCKVSVFRAFLVSIFLYSDWKRRDTLSLYIQSECRKIWTRKTPDTDTFHPVTALASFHFNEIFNSCYATEEEVKEILNLSSEKSN